jgi:hypothetical protein
MFHRCRCGRGLRPARAAPSAPARPDKRPGPHWHSNVLSVWSEPFFTKVNLLDILDQQG